MFIDRITFNEGLTIDRRPSMPFTDIEVRLKSSSFRYALSTPVGYIDYGRPNFDVMSETLRYAVRGLSSDFEQDLRQTLRRMGHVI